MAQLQIILTTTPTEIATEVAGALRKGINGGLNALTDAIENGDPQAGHFLDLALQLAAHWRNDHFGKNKRPTNDDAPAPAAAE